MEALRLEFPRVFFRRVYVSEAHPVDEWRVYAGIDYKQPTRLNERWAACQQLLAENPGLKADLVLDNMENEAEKRYAAHPERLYVVDNTSGCVAYKGGMGPFGYSPDELRAFLQTL